MTLRANEACDNSFRFYVMISRSLIRSEAARSLQSERMYVPDLQSIFNVASGKMPDRNEVSWID